MKNISFQNIFENKRNIFIMSVALAVIAWLVVSLGINNEISVTIRNVPVNLSYNAQTYKSYGIDIVDNTDKFVTITIKGKRNVVGNITEADFIAHLQYTSVVQAGDYELPVIVTKVNPIAAFEITNVRQGQMTVRFDKIATKVLPITINTQSILLAENCVLSEPFTRPAEVVLTGPEADVQKIAQVRVQYANAKPLENTVIATCPLEFVDADGAVVTFAFVKADVANVELNVPVLKVMNLPLEVEFKNVPKGFDVATLGVQLSASSLAVTCPTSEVGQPLVIGEIDLSKIKFGWDYNFDIALPSGYTPLDDVKTIHVSLSWDKLAQKTIDIKKIEIINEPVGYKVTAKTKTLNNITFIGTIEAIDALSESNATAQINADEIAPKFGQQQVNAYVVLNGISGAYATGTARVLVEIGER